MIDDDDAIVTSLTSVLAHEGHDVAGAHDGREGLAIFAERPVDLVVVDIFMPEKEGLETILELRRHGADVKIIAMSGGGGKGIADYLEAARHLGADRTLRKPFSMDEFVEVTREVLGQGSNSR